MRRPDKRSLTLIVGLFGLALLVGCQLAGDSSKSSGSGRVQADDSQIRNLFPNRSNRRDIVTLGVVDVIDLSFNILRIELPVGTVRHSRKIWNHVDELAIDEQLLIRLARNGVRIGSASPESWPAIRAILNAGDAQLNENQVPGLRGLPLTLEIAPIEGEESIFAYDKTGSLNGRTFKAGRKLLVVDYSFRPELSGAVDMRVSLEVRRDRGYMTWERTTEGIRQVPAYKRHIFEDIVVDVLVPPKGFLVIGPGESASNEFLVGGKFFGLSSGGSQREVIYIITPIPVHSNVKKPS